MELELPLIPLLLLLFWFAIIDEIEEFDDGLIEFELGFDNEFKGSLPLPSIFCYFNGSSFSSSNCEISLLLFLTIFIWDIYF